METQAICFENTCFCTVFVVQNGEVTILDKKVASSPSEIQTWLKSNGFPTAGLRLIAKSTSGLPDGFYIDPHLREFYYSVDPSTNKLTGESPHDFLQSVPLEF